MTNHPNDQEISPSPDQGRTELPPPGMRTFFKQSRSETMAGVFWSIVLKILFRWSFRSWYHWRVCLLRCFGANVHWTVKLDRSITVRLPKHLNIGCDTFIHEGVVLNCIGMVHIGERVFIDRYGHICAASHDYSRRDMQLIKAPITIGDDVKLSTDVFVGPNVSIGDRTVVGPRSSVVKSLPCDIIAQGEPAMGIDDSGV